MKTNFLLASMALLFLACTTHPHDKGRERYLEDINRFSAGDKQFAGLYHNFEFRATLMTSQVSKSIHKRMNHFYDWTPEESEQKWQEQNKVLNKETKIFLSFFTPERKNDNLANKNSIWKVYLKVGSNRYEGHATKANKNLEEAKALFPYHSRWATAYYVTFPVSTYETESDNVRLVITGPLGRREVAFTSQP